MIQDYSFHLWTLATVNLAAATLFVSTELLSRWHRRRSREPKPLPLDDWIAQMDREDGGDFLPRTAESCRDTGQAA